MLFRKFLVCLLAIFLFAIGTPTKAQDPANGIFQGVKALHAAAQSKPEDERIDDYRGIRRLLDIIVNDHPSSDLAVRILLQEEIEGVDIAAIDAKLEAAQPAQRETSGNTASPGTDESETAAQSKPLSNGSVKPTLPNSTSAETESAADLRSHMTPSVATKSTEAALDLDRQAVRDVQARLSVLGFDPNGIDGLVGRGTRSALSAWQGTQGIEPTGYLNASQLDLLRSSSQQALAVWLRDPENAKIYDPPIITLGPSNMSGTWRFTSNCGSSSRLGRQRITGVMSMRHVGKNNYTGALANSQGLRGRVSATLRGRSVSGTVNFGLLFGKVSLSARVDDEKLVLRGRDSNRCSFYAAKS